MKKHTIKSWRVLLDKQKIEGYLNIAKKAGYLLIGGENIKNAILHNRKIFLVIYDPSIQNNSLKIIRKVEELSIPTKSLKDLSSYIKIYNCKILALKNKKLSDIIYNIID